jgi:hypothetical protein
MNCKRAQMTDHKGSSSKKKKAMNSSIPSWASKQSKQSKPLPTSIPEISIDPNIWISHPKGPPQIPFLLLQWRPQWYIGELHRQKFAFKKELEKFGKTEDVLGDGNCGFYAILVGLERLRKIERKSVTEFRKELWEYAHTNEMKIRNDAFPESQKKGIGKAISWETDVLAPLFCEGSSYEKGCRLSSWISGQWHFPLIAYKFQVTIVVYSSDKSKRQGEIILEKRTTIFKSNGECEWLTRRLQHPCKLLVDMASTIFLVHMHGIHYLHLYVPSNIQPPDKDELEMEEPEQRNESNPILDNELEMGGPSTIV